MVMDSLYTIYKIVVLCGFSRFIIFNNHKKYFFFLDINKFLWMVRIGGSTDRGSHIKEWDYYTPQGEFRVDKEGSPVLLNCLMYKMCYYRFGSVYTEGGRVLFEKIDQLSYV